MTNDKSCNFLVGSKKIIDKYRESNRPQTLSTIPNENSKYVEN